MIQKQAEAVVLEFSSQEEEEASQQADTAFQLV